MRCEVAAKPLGECSSLAWQFCLEVCGRSLRAVHCRDHQVSYEADTVSLSANTSPSGFLSMLERLTALFDEVVGQAAYPPRQPGGRVARCGLEAVSGEVQLQEVGRTAAEHRRLEAVI